MIDNLNDENNYKLVHASGRCSTKELVSDERFGISKDDSVKLKRVVEVYQWVEHRETQNRDGNEVTNYSYSKEWSKTLQNQDTYAKSPTGHDSELRNPSKWPCES